MSCRAASARAALLLRVWPSYPTSAGRFVDTPAVPSGKVSVVYSPESRLEPAFERAKALNCLSREDVHDAPGASIVVRPWGERSFYAEDPWGNPLCFVEEGTVYTGSD